jgi:endonuclease YncB( thermonuclease family)
MSFSELNCVRDIWRGLASARPYTSHASNRFCHFGPRTTAAAAQGRAIIGTATIIHADTLEIHSVRVRCRAATDRYGRMVARCEVAGVDLSEWLI